MTNPACNAMTVVKAPFILAAALLLSCSNSNVSGRTDEAVDTGDFFRLDEDEFNKLYSRSNAGDSSASFKLYMHFAAGGESFGSSEHSADYWLEKAAEQGDARAQQHLLVAALSEGTPDGCAVARRHIETYALMSKIERGEIRVSDVDLKACGISL